MDKVSRSLVYSINYVFLISAYYPEPELSNQFGKIHLPRFYKLLLSAQLLKHRNTFITILLCAHLTAEALHLLWTCLSPFARVKKSRIIQR